MPGTTVNGSRNDPFRGSKRTTLEGGIRVPFFVTWPGHIKPGVYDRPAIQLDLTATAVVLAGANSDKLEGVNLLPFLAGENTGAPHDALYWRFGRQMAIRAGDYKLIRYDSNADTRTGGRGQPVTVAKLFNLSVDLGETKDLAASMPDKVKELQAKWDAWDQHNIAPLWGSGGKADNDGAEPGGRPRRKKAKQASSRNDSQAGRSPSWFSARWFRLAPTRLRNNRATRPGARCAEITSPIATGGMRGTL